MSVHEPSVVETADPAGRRVRAAALVGAGLALLLALIWSGSVTENDLGYAVWIVLAWVVALGLFCGRGRRLLWARPELLVPVGVVLPLEVALEWLAAVPKLEPLMKPLATITLWGVGVSFSVPTVLAAVLWSAFAAWQTDLLGRGLTESGPLDLSPVGPIRRGFWRAFGVLAVGKVGLILLTVPVATVFGSDHLAGFVFFLTLVTLLWNLATFALVPWVLLSPEPFTAAVGTGFKKSLSHKLMFTSLAVLQLALLGVWTYFSRLGNWSFHVHSPWVGGYECQSDWYTDQLGQVMSRSPFVATVLMGLFLVLAVAVKVTVVSALLSKPAAVPGAGMGPNADAAESA